MRTVLLVSLFAVAGCAVRAPADNSEPAPPVEVPSNNVGKLEGRWKATAMSGFSKGDPTVEKMFREGTLVVLLEFRDGSKIRMTLRNLGRDTSWEADFTLGPADAVNFTNFSPPREDGVAHEFCQITITGDTMTYVDSWGDRSTFVRTK